MAAYLEYGLEGRTAIITGAGTGIGAGTAVELAKAGAKVALFGRRLDKLEEVREQCLAYTKDVLCLSTDVADRAQVNENVGKVVKAYDKIDILVNNAGIETWLKPGETYFDDYFEYLSDDDYLSFFRTHALGHYLMNLACIPSMKEHHYGRIVNNASITGISGSFSTPAYCGSKAAAICQTKSFAHKYTRSGIYTNCIAEGMVETPLKKNATPEEYAAASERSPFGHVAQPVDIARVILFLAQENLYMSGQCIIVGVVV